MKFINTTLNAFLICSLLTAFTACNGQHQKSTETQAINSYDLGDTVSKIGKNIRCIFQDTKNNFWFASDGDGLFKFDGKTILQLTDKQGLQSNLVRHIQEDKNGMMLVTTTKGVSIFDGKQFSSVQPAENTKPSNDFLNATLLLGDYYQNKVLYKFELPQTSKLAKNYSQTPYAIYCSYKDSKGNIWFGTESRGVCKFDGKTFTWLDNEELGLAVRSIFEDKSGNIWIGNNGYGLFRYDGKTLTNFTKEHKLENLDFQTTLKGKESTLARVWTITDDKLGNLLIGTIDAGLWKYNGKVLTNFTTKDGLTSNSISTIFCDKDGSLWIGCDNGATKYDGKIFTAFGGQK